MVISEQKFCTNCGAGVLESARFCQTCGADLTMQVAEPLSQEQRQFSKIKARSLAIWAVASAPLAGVIVAIVGANRDLDIEDPTTFTIIFSGWWYGFIVTWLIWQFSRRRVDVSKLVGRVPDGYRWGPTLGIVLATAAFSIGISQIVVNLLARIDPEFAVAVLNQDLFIEATESSSPGLYLIVLFVSIVIAAPIVEEALFRGVLIHRWTVKWSLPTAIIVSSIIFGLGHDLSVVGAAVFGVVFSLIYIETKTLIVPIICHMLNNGVVLVYALALRGIESIIGDFDPATTDQLDDNSWLAMILIVISVPFLVRFIRARWPSREHAPPLFSSE